MNGSSIETTPGISAEGQQIITPRAALVQTAVNNVVNAPDVVVG